MPYLGRYYRIDLVDGAGAIQFEQKFLVPRELEDKSYAFRDWFMARAEEKILPRVVAYAEEFGCGVQGRQDRQW